MNMTTHIRTYVIRDVTAVVALTMGLLPGCVLSSDDIRAAAAQSLADFANGLGGSVLLDLFNMAFGVK